jgi:hypothetical protein
MRKTPCALMVAVFSLLVWASNALTAEEFSRAWQQVNGKRELSLASASTFDEIESEGQLNTGGMLLHPAGDYRLRTPLTTIVAKRNSLMFVRVVKGFEHIFLLLGHARVQVGDHSAMLHAGEEALVSDHTPTVAELMQADSIGRRRLHMAQTGNGRVLGIAEFSLVHAIEREPVIYRLVHSKHPRDRTIKEQLIKMAAVLNYVTATHGQYITGPR